MSDDSYTPSTKEVLSAYFRFRGYHGLPVEVPKLTAELNRWLAAHDAALLASVAPADTEWEYGVMAEGDDEPYTDTSDDPEWVAEHALAVLSDVLVRRRKAGPWGPVPTERSFTTSDISRP